LRSVDSLNHREYYFTEHAVSTPKGREMQDESYRQPHTPKGLGEAGRKLWALICQEWGLEGDASELAVLKLACEAQDRVELAQTELNRAESLTIVDRFGQLKEHPLIAVVARERAAVTSAVDQISRSQLNYRRLVLAEGRHEAQKADRDRPRSRRGGGRRLVGG
jgi:hypothetical protein